LDDIESEVESFANNVEVSPQRLEQVEQRMSLLYYLMHKYNCTTIEELISMRDSLATSLEDTVQLEQSLEQYEQQERVQFKKLQELAKELSNRRKESAQKFAEQLQQDIRSLEMPRAEIKIEVSPLESLASTGADKVDFFFGANGAGALSEISKVASGGELSRVMLALKSIVAKYTSLPTMIFDEIDTGVSGKIADKMGDMIGQMGENMQIFAITHLPQIASKKGAHYLVYKEFDGDGQARTYIKQLSEKERINEVARMLSGSQLTDTAILNAEELINRSK
jgi:DNA repair protein RecN (Recombination protein N)